jgi:tRNA (cytidine32/guanosine34-2'-O)-methyltransferase
MAAINITTHLLCCGGTFVAKIFRTREVGLMYTQLQLLFEDVQVAKPTASRNASVESFVVCRGFGYGKLGIDKCLDLPLEGGWDEEFSGVGGLREYPGQKVEPSVVPFVSCAKLDGVDSGGFEFLDADKSYPVGVDKAKTVLAPWAPPIQPPYEMAKMKESKSVKS